MSKQRSSEKPEDITGLLLAGENWKESVKRKKIRGEGKKIEQEQRGVASRVRKKSK